MNAPTRTNRLIRLIRIAAALLAAASPAVAQPHVESRHEIAWNRYYTVAEIESHMKALERAYPDIVRVRSIGKSYEGRDLWVAIVTAPGTDHRAKPAMWIDGSIHANEIQASEVCLYSIWYLATYYGHNDRITEILDDYAFYIMPIVSPDSRVAWFERPSTPHSRRANQMPVDADRDGLIGEDDVNDLDGDGSITQMWKRDPRGQWVRNRYDPRIFERVPPGEFGDWTYLGQEGIDDDGDGRVSEDGTDGFDMNRNWPADWQPNYVQRGAGAFPFSAPETRAIGEFCYAHPNIAAFQSYHNTGGMILRGPGSSHRARDYPREDLRVYDELGRLGEQMLPYYRYLIIHADLYNVHGGEATWASEGLGVISFTNELWTVEKYFQRPGRPTDEQMWMFRDKLQFGMTFKDYTEVEHPHHGTVLVGGLNKWSSRSTPTFMLEEEAHRNFAFTVYHAGEMPRLSFDRTRVEHLGADMWTVTVEVRNEKIIPTRTARMRTAGIGRADLLTLEGAEVLTSGSLSGWWDHTIDEVRFEPGRVRLDAGVPGRGAIVHRFFVRGARGDEVTVRYSAEKATDITTAIRLQPTEND
ncbi:MAG: M14 family metallopeptidase [Phycisphaerales bacterium]|nr:peptidase M14 [Planctomycetota bacterium]MCH8508897.1 M14 family metallopeptidase [Phycisphaerales bacterium]